MNNLLACRFCRILNLGRSNGHKVTNHHLIRQMHRSYNEIHRNQWFNKFYKNQRFNSTNAMDNRHKSALLYLSSAAVLACGLSYAAVPLYRLYCQASGYGSAKQDIDFGIKIADMERVDDRILTVRFEAGTSKTLRWKFKPQQKEVKLAPGETALAFYTAENLTEDPIIGIATYNIIPFEAGQYFNKIQCFCFEEQQLNSGEEVDMPVFFYIDPDFMEDPKLAKYDELILSYTFFQSNETNAPGASAQPHG